MTEQEIIKAANPWPICKRDDCTLVSQTDTERLDFLERHPRSIGLSPKWVGSSEDGYHFEWINIREMIDRAINESMRPKTVSEKFLISQPNAAPHAPVGGF
jgi:hypothetical protein